MALNRFALNPRTQTIESGKYYAGKEKADKAYASELNRPTSPYTAQGITARRQAAAAKPKAGMTQDSLQSLAETAATTEAESELQDELAAANEAQAARTAEYAQAIGTAARPPGGSIRRGTTTIGQASGAGLAQANMEARRKTKLDAAKARAKLGVAETLLGRAQPGQLSTDRARTIRIG